MAASRDPLLYDDPITIQVETTLFRVPKQIFMSSPVFADMFSMPQDITTHIDGSSDMHPLKLEGVAASDFRPLLTYLYPLPYLPKLDSQGWTSVLRLSRLYEMDTARHEAIKALETLLPYNTHAAERLALSITHCVPEWRISALSNLITRKEPMGINDITLLGAELVLKIAAVREEHGPQALSCRMRVETERECVKRTCTESNDAILNSITTLLATERDVYVDSLPGEFGRKKAQSSG